MIEGNLPCHTKGCEEFANWRVEKVIEPEYFDEFRMFEKIRLVEPEHYAAKNYCNKCLAGQMPSGLISENREYWPPHKFREYWDTKNQNG